MTTGNAVAIRPTPWIDQSLCALEVGPSPVRQICRRLHQGGKPDLLGRVAAILQIEQLQRCRDVLDLNLSGLCTGLSEIAENLRCRHGHEQDEDAQHHKELEQGEPGLGRIARFKSKNVCALRAWFLRVRALQHCADHSIYSFLTSCRSA